MVALLLYMKTKVIFPVVKSAVIILTLLAFANCAKKTNSSSKDKPKADATTTNPPKSETDTSDFTPPPFDDTDSARNTTTPQQPAPMPDAGAGATLPAPSATSPSPSSPVVPETGAAGNDAAPAASKSCPTSDEEITDPELARLCTKLIVSEPKKIEQCLLKSVEDFTVLLKMEQSEITTQNMKEIIENAKTNCDKSSELTGDLLKTVNQRLKEVVTREFPAAADLVILFTESANHTTPAPPTTTPSPAGATQKPAASTSTVETTEYHLQSLLQKGSRDFRQKDGSMNYSISSVEGKGTVTKLENETAGPVTNLSSLQKNYFSKVATYSFGLTLKANKLYTLVYKDEAGELTLDYAFYEGSAEGLKKGESAKISLTKASWLKVIEHETQKLLNKYYPNTPRSAMKILLSPLDPPTSRTCSIGKGYFMGSHAIACLDPDYRVRIQILN